MRLLESFLNFIIWAIHDIGRAIKYNPLTEAWMKMQDTFDTELLEPIECDLQHLKIPQYQNSLGVMLIEAEKKRAGIESRLPPTGFKEHVRREARILEGLKPIRIWHQPYAAFSLARPELLGSIEVEDLHKPKQKWWNSLGGGIGGFL